MQSNAFRIYFFSPLITYPHSHQTLPYNITSDNVCLTFQLPPRAMKSMVRNAMLRKSSPLPQIHRLKGVLGTFVFFRAPVPCRC